VGSGSGVGSTVGDGAVGVGLGTDEGWTAGVGSDGRAVEDGVAGGTRTPTTPGPAALNPGGGDIVPVVVPVGAAEPVGVAVLPVRVCSRPDSVLSGSMFADATIGASASAMGASARAPGRAVVDGFTVPAATL
jgi:hypothetical protein